MRGIKEQQADQLLLFALAIFQHGWRLVRNRNKTTNWLHEIILRYLKPLLQIKRHNGFLLYYKRQALPSMGAMSNIVFTGPLSQIEARHDVCIPVNIANLIKIKLRENDNPFRIRHDTDSKVDCDL